MRPERRECARLRNPGLITLREPGAPTRTIRSPIIRFHLADAGRSWRRADYLFGGAGQAGALLARQRRTGNPGTGSLAPPIPR